MKHWEIPTGLNSQSICYSAGVGEDISFDLDLIKKHGLTVHGFDPTDASAAYVEQLRKRKTALLAHYVFHKYGLWSADKTVKFHVSLASSASTTICRDLATRSKTAVLPCRRLCSVMRDLGHKKLDLLKLDVEGAEFAILKSLLDDKLFIRVILVEFHGTKGRHYRAQLGEKYAFMREAALSDLKAGGYVILKLVASKGRRPCYASLMRS